jgi:type I restriction enzyme S subunit
LAKADVSLVQPDDVPDLPDHWVWARLGIIATRMDSGWSPACIPEPAAKGEWGVLKTTAVQTLQYQEVQNKALPPNLEPRPEHEVMDGDILFTRAGPMNRVGILCVARPTRNKLMISDKIIRFHLVTGIDPDFAALSMNAGFSSTVVEGLKSGMAASQVNISQPKLRSVPIPLPPLAEQRRIVAKVEELMKLVDELETQLAASRATAANLLAALVAELTGNPNTAKVSVPASTAAGTGTGRRGRPPKS